MIDFSSGPKEPAPPKGPAELSQVPRFLITIIHIEGDWHAQLTSFGIQIFSGNSNPACKDSPTDPYIWPSRHWNPFVFSKKTQTELGLLFY